MTPLHRKLFRDFWHLRGQVIAIAMVVACGVATVVTSRTAYESLIVSQATYYADYRFADVFAHLKRAPNRLASRIRGNPGCRNGQNPSFLRRHTDVPGLSEPATGESTRSRTDRFQILNDLFIRRGRYVAPGERSEVLVSEAFAEANGLELGDTLGAILNGRSAPSDRWYHLPFPES